MKKYLKIIISGLLLLNILACNKDIIEVENYDDLKKIIEQEVEDNNIPGLAVSIVKDGNIEWKENFGYQNIENNTLVNDQTIFMIASISKTITATALLQLFEDNKIALDDDINNYLPFEIKNPNFPDKSITFRMLLSHVSSISDDGNQDDPFYVFGGDPVLSLSEAVRGYFEVGGAYYNANDNFFDNEPGTYFSYSNLAYALIGYLVEIIENKPFDEYCEDNIFQPLEMNSTGWMLADIDLNKKAVNYNEDFAPYQHYTFADYPNGQLLTTTSDLSNFLLTHIQEGTFKNETLLTSSTIEQIRTLQFENVQDEFGLGWYYETMNGDPVIGHHGSELGITTTMLYKIDKNIGIIILSNGEDLDLDNIAEKMFEVAEK